MKPSKNIQKTNKTKKPKSFQEDGGRGPIFPESIVFFGFISFLNVFARFHWFSFVFQWFSLLLTRKPMKTIEKPMETNET